MNDKELNSLMNAIGQLEVLKAENTRLKELLKKSLLYVEQSPDLPAIEVEEEIRSAINPDKK